jgi:hypothetical protein
MGTGFLSARMSGTVSTRTHLLALCQRERGEESITDPSVNSVRTSSHRLRRLLASRHTRALRAAALPFVAACSSPEDDPAPAPNPEP